MKEHLFINSRIVTFVAVVIVVLLSGCVTSKLYEPKKYYEKISTVLITEDRKKIAVITKDYHYIFDSNDVLVNILQSSIHGNITGRIKRFEVDADGVTTGGFYLELKKDATREEKAEVLELGFKQARYGRFLYEGRLKGMRYSANINLSQLEAYQLNRNYRVYVKEEQNFGEKAMKTALTPITLAADGVLVIASIPLLAGFMLFYDVK